jgi:hypothetical protein
MPKNETSLDMTIQISGTFDIAPARQNIRRLSEKLDWTPTIRLRAIAAFTALAEIGHVKDRQRREPLVIYLKILNREDGYVIEFHTDANLDGIAREYPVARWQLERVSDEFEVEPGEKSDHIVMRILAIRRR